MKKLLASLLVILTLSSCTPKGTPDFASLKTDYRLGSGTASILVELYSDYGCPACQYFEKNTFPFLKANFIDTGKIQYVFHSFPIHPDSFQATESVYCAGEQGKYWEMHSILFEHQKEQFPKALKEYAQNLGLDMQQFSDCFDTRKYKDYVEFLYQQAVDNNVTKTPTLFINKSKLQGAIGYEELAKIITDIMAQK